ncbi:hypothetical protein ACJX0J_010446, partial [Zea mays]
HFLLCAWDTLLLLANFQMHVSIGTYYVVLMLGIQFILDNWSPQGSICLKKKRILVTLFIIALPLEGLGNKEKMPMHGQGSTQQEAIIDLLHPIMFTAKRWIPWLDV